MTKEGHAHDSRTPAVADRYISFKGIDYDGNVARVLAHLDRQRTQDVRTQLPALSHRVR